MTEALTNTVGIVGGGIVGTATALSLARMGYKATIIDPQVVDRAASWGNAGTLNPSSIIPVNFPGLIGKNSANVTGLEQPVVFELALLAEAYALDHTIRVSLPKI